MEFGRDLLFLWNQFRRYAVEHWKGWLLWMGLIFLLTGLVCFRMDREWLQWIQTTEGLGSLEKFCDFWGDFLQFSIGFGLILLGIAVWRKDRWLRRGAIAFMLAGILSGVTTRMVKCSVGRARPGVVERENMHWVTFTGPNVKRKYNSYFSGHTATAMASAVALALVVPRIGLVTVLFAMLVGWSRLYGNHHFPSDVIHGAAWGTFWGILVAGGMIGIRRRARIFQRQESGRKGGRTPQPVAVHVES